MVRHNESGMAKVKKSQKLDEAEVVRGARTPKKAKAVLATRPLKRLKKAKAVLATGRVEEDGRRVDFEGKDFVDRLYVKQRPLDPPTDEATVINRAVDVIGDREEALRWLGTPVRALGYATPISKLKDEVGAKEVMSVLAALEQGSW
jgi:hypothetical protein